MKVCAFFHGEIVCMREKMKLNDAYDFIQDEYYMGEDELNDCPEYVCPNDMFIANDSFVIPSVKDDPNYKLCFPEIDELPF